MNIPKPTKCWNSGCKKDWSKGNLYMLAVYPINIPLKVPLIHCCEECINDFLKAMDHACNNDLRNACAFKTLTSGLCKCKTRFNNKKVHITAVDVSKTIPKECGTAAPGFVEYSICNLHIYAAKRYFKKWF